MDAETFDYSAREYPLAPICEAWLGQIETGLKVKQRRFGQYADEAMRFYDGDHSWMWNHDYAAGPNGFMDENGRGNLPNFRITVNKLFESVALFGPALFNRYPKVLCEPVKRPVISPESLGIDTRNPEAAQAYQNYQHQHQRDESLRLDCSRIKEHYLNWCQVEGGKLEEARCSITESIVKGLGLLRTDLHVSRGSGIRYPRTTHVNVDDYVKDPDAEYHQDVQWIAIYNCAPRNVVERMFELKPGTVKGAMRSYRAQSDREMSSRLRTRSREVEDSSDLCEYWEVWSKNGFGQNIKGIERTRRDKKKFDFGPLGDFCYLALSPGVPFPLNVPPDVMRDSRKLFSRAQWPTPFYADEGRYNGWPVCELYYYATPGSVWPIGTFKPVIGELRFVNWCLSFLADKVADTCTTYVAVLKAAAMEIADQLDGGRAPFTKLEISDALAGTNFKIGDIIQFMQAPEFPESIWRMVSEVLNLIDKRTGLTELVYGLTGSQMRSATEASVRQENISVRPDDMSSRVESVLGESAVKELQVASWHLGYDDVEPCLGSAGAKLFEDYVTEGAFDRIVHDYDYRIEAGTSRKPNRVARLDNMLQFGEKGLPVMQQLALQGFTQPWNAYIEDLGKLLEIDSKRYLVDPQEMQQFIQSQNQEPDPANDPQVQAAAQKLQIEAQAIQQKVQLEAQTEMQKQQIEAQIAERKMALEAEIAQRKAEIDALVKMQDVQLKQVAARADMDIEREKSALEITMDSQRFAQELRQDEEMHDQDVRQSKQDLVLKKKESEARAAAAHRKPSGGSGK